MEGLLTTKSSKKSDLLIRESTDYGKDGVFESLDGVCVSETVSEYEYEMCFFGSANQKSSGSHINLGTWSNWTGPADSPYSEALFKDGTTCWNGPARSLRVKFTCGAEEKILSVQEPSKCEYLMEMQTAALCDESVVPRPDPLESFESISNESDQRVNRQEQEQEQEHVEL